MRLKAARTTLYSVAHFAVDFGCAFYIFTNPHYQNPALQVIIYNFFAFAVQMPLGVLLDRFGGNKRFAGAGAFLVAMGAFLGNAPMVLPVVIGLGNALFHVGAGRDVLCENRGKLTALGIFVSPGAIGLFFGKVLGGGGLSLFVPAAVLVFLAAAMLALPTLEETELNGFPEPPKLKTGLLIACFTALFAVVILRSFVGMTLSFPWKSEGNMGLYLVLALALGKTAGGFLADRFGSRLIALCSLLAAAVLLFFYKTPACGLIAVLLFNMTMPITLGGIARLRPRALGFGFGLLTFALFLGALPVLLKLPMTLSMPVAAAAACLVSAALLFFGLRGTSHGK